MDALGLTRTVFTDLSTIGELWLGGEFFCHTLEDTCRKGGIKVYGETSIPQGRYQVVLTPSPRFGRIMPRLVDVPNYEGVLIHWGNKPSNTAGCILVGHYNPKLPDWISDSKATFDRLFERLTELKKAGEIWINVRGGRYRDERMVA